MRCWSWSDLHGRLDLFEEGLKHIAPDDIVYFLGDAADRSIGGWTIIKRILNDKRFIYIIGNHEDLMVKAMRRYGEEKYDPYYLSSDMELWYWNGGQYTHDEFLEDDIPEEEKIKYLKELRELPFCAVYNNAQGQRVLLSHAGCDDFKTANDWDREHFIWDRTHNMFFDSWYGEDDEIIVHGHTPIELMIDEQSKHARWAGFYTEPPIKWDKKGAYWYGKGHKVNIDTGAVWNNVSVLLDLDTWEEIRLEVAQNAVI